MGQVRTCMRFQKGKAGLRCAEFKERVKETDPKHPVCDARLKGGGRSPGLIRKGRCAGPRSSPVPASQMKRRRKSAKKARR